MQYSGNLHLNLPEDTDPLDVSKLSENFEKLDELAKLADPYKVGDILPTLRTDLGEKWLLCNGEPLDAAQFPELAGMMLGLESMANMASVTAVGSPLSSTCFADAYATDGVNQLITTAQYRKQQANYLLWSNDNFKTHTSISAGGCTHIRPFFVNGYWIIFLFQTTKGGGQSGSYGDTRAVKISVQSQPFTDLSGASEPPSSLNILDVYHVEYIGGKYYAFCGETSSRKAMIVASDSPHFFAPTVSYAGIVGGTFSSPFSFLRTENQFAFFGIYNKILNAAWSDAPASGYQTRTLDQNSQTTAGARAFQGYSKPLYVDGKVLWVGYSGTTGNVKVTVICLDGIESGGVKYIEIGNANMGDCSTSILASGRGEYVIFWYENSSESSLFVGTDPLDASTWKKCSLGGKAVKVNYVCLQYAHNGLLNAFTMDGNLVTVPTCAAPKIGISNCYAYIKAK